MNQKFNYYRELEDVELYLCNPDRRELFSVFATDRQVALRFNDLSNLTANVPATISLSNGEKIAEAEYYDYVETNRLIHAKNIGWFKIKSVNEEDNGTNKYKAIEAESLQSIFKYRGVVIPEGTYKFYDPSDPYDDAYEEYVVNSETASGVIPTPSVVGQLVRQLGINLDPNYGDREVRAPYGDWTITYISDVLWSSADPAIYRSFDETATNAYDWMVNDVEKAFNVVILFDFENLAIKIKTAEEATKRSNLCFSFSNFMNQIQVTEDASEIVTVLNCSGDGVDITQVNPTGANYIVDFSYYMDEVNHRWMSDELISKLKEWELVVEANKEEYTSLIGDLREKYLDKTKLETQLTHVQTSLLDLRNARDKRIVSESEGTTLTGIITAESVGITDRKEVTGQKTSYEVAHSYDEASAYYWGNEGFSSDAVVTCYTTRPAYDETTKTFKFTGTGRTATATDNYNTEDSDSRMNYCYFMDGTDGSSYCKLTAAAKVSTENTSAGKTSVFSLCDYNVSVGEEFSIEYHGSSPSVEAPSFLSYYDDGGVLMFKATAAGTGTIYLSTSDVLLGSYTVSAVGTSTEANDEYDYKVLLGGTFFIAYEGDAPSVECPDLLEYYDDGGILEFTAINTGSATLVLNNAVDGTQVASYSVCVEERQDIETVRPSTSVEYYCDGFERYVPYSDVGLWIEKKEKIENQLSASIKTLEKEIAEVAESLDKITAKCNLISFMSSTPRLLRELNCYWIEGEFSNENIAAQEDSTLEEIIALAEELLESGKIELAKVSQPRFSFTLEASNVIRRHEFKEQCDELELGRIITVEKEDGVWYTPALLEMVFGLDHGDEEFSLKFGNKLKLDDWGYTYADLISESASTSRQVSSNWQNLMSYSKNKDAIQNLLNNPLDATLRTGLANAVNQDFIIDDTGILGRKKTSAGDGTFENEQLRMINNLLLFTDDSWETIKTALGKVIYEEDGVTKTAYGLLAEVLIGSLIMGNQLKIKNQDSSIVMDDTGITIRNSSGDIVFQASTDGTLQLSKYLNSDEAAKALKEFFDKEFADDLEKIQTQIDGKAETWCQAEDPSINWDDTAKEAHTGDMWLKTTDNSTYFWDGTKWVAQTIPEDLFDEVDKKAQVFVKTPVPPYYEKDLWVQGNIEGGSNDILVCTHSREENEVYHVEDWVRASDYTNDSAVDEVKANIYYPGTTKINGGSIETGTVTADALRTDALMSKDYDPGEAADVYSKDGTYFNLADGALTSMNFAITPGGNVHLKGNVYAENGQIGPFAIDKDADSDNVALAYPRGASLAGDGDDQEESVYIGKDGIRYGNAFFVRPDANDPYIQTKRGVFDAFTIGSQTITAKPPSNSPFTLFDAKNDEAYLTAYTIPYRLRELEKKVAELRGESLADVSYYADIFIGEYVSIPYDGTPPAIKSYPSCLGEPYEDSIQIDFEGIAPGTGAILVAGDAEGVTTSYAVRVKPSVHTGVYTMYVGDTITISGFKGRATGVTFPSCVTCTNKATFLLVSGTSVGSGTIYVYIQNSLVGEYTIQVLERQIDYDKEIGETFSIENSSAQEFGDVEVSCAEHADYEHIEDYFDITTDSGHVTLIGTQKGRYTIILGYDNTEFGRYTVRISEVIRTEKSMNIGDSFTVSYAGLESTTVVCPACLSYVDNIADRAVTFTAISAATDAIAKVRIGDTEINKFVVTVNAIPTEQKNLTVGESFTIPYSALMPGIAVVWDDKYLKSVDNGSQITFTALATGSTVVTVANSGKAIHYYNITIAEKPKTYMVTCEYVSQAGILLGDSTEQVADPSYTIKAAPSFDGYEFNNSITIDEDVYETPGATITLTADTTTKIVYEYKAVVTPIDGGTKTVGDTWIVIDDIKNYTVTVTGGLSVLDDSNGWEVTAESVGVGTVTITDNRDMLVVSITNYTIVAKSPEETCEHVWDEGICTKCNAKCEHPTEGDPVWTNKNAMDCQTYAHYQVSCMVCNELIREWDDDGIVGEHTYGGTPVVTPATCTTGGYTTYTCTKCGYLYNTDYTEPNGHSYGVDGGWVTVEEPTCTSDGSEKHTCNNCGVTETRSIQATGHTEVIDQAVEATCTDTGLTEGKHCSVCHIVIVAQTVVEANGHTEAIDELIPPTCTAQGMTEGKHCSVCGEVLASQFPIPAKGHTPNISEATCTEAKVCTVCGTVLEKALEHYSEDGYYSYDSSEHYKICARCGERYDISGHSIEYASGEDATCTEDGYESYEYCSVCGYEEEPTVIPAGHSYNEGVVTPPTCEADGYTTYTCRVCEYENITDYVGATGHDYSPKVTEPTCTEQGYTTYTCSCGDSYTGNYTAAKGHTEGDPVLTNEDEMDCSHVCAHYAVYCTDCGALLKEYDNDGEYGDHKYESTVYEPTCVSSGYTRHTCVNCGSYYDDNVTPIDKDNHDMPISGVVTPPTCTEGGYTTWTCQRGCGYSETGNYTSATGHDYVDETYYCTSHSGEYIDPTCRVCGHRQNGSCPEC